MKGIASKEKVYGDKYYIDLIYHPEGTFKWVVDNYFEGFDKLNEKFDQEDDIVGEKIDNNDYFVKITFRDTKNLPKNYKAINYFISNYSAYNALNGYEYTTWFVINNETTGYSDGEKKVYFYLMADHHVNTIDYYGKKFKGNLLIQRGHENEYRYNKEYDAFIPDFENNKGLRVCDEICGSRNYKQSFKDDVQLSLSTTLKDGYLISTSGSEEARQTTYGCRTTQIEYKRKGANLPYALFFIPFEETFKEDGTPEIQHPDGGKETIKKVGPFTNYFGENMQNFIDGFTLKYGKILNVQYTCVDTRSFPNHHYLYGFNFSALDKTKPTEGNFYYGFSKCFYPCYTGSNAPHKTHNSVYNNLRCYFTMVLREISASIPFKKFLNIYNYDELKRDKINYNPHLEVEEHTTRYITTINKQPIKFDLVNMLINGNKIKENIKGENLELLEGIPIFSLESIGIDGYLKDGATTLNQKIYQRQYLLSCRGQNNVGFSENSFFEGDRQNRASINASKANIEIQNNTSKKNSFTSLIATSIANIFRAQGAGATAVVNPAAGASQANNIKANQIESVGGFYNSMRNAKARKKMDMNTLEGKVGDARNMEANTHAQGISDMVDEILKTTYSNKKMFEPIYFEQTIDEIDRYHVVKYFNKYGYIINKGKNVSSFDELFTRRVQNYYEINNIDEAFRNIDMDFEIKEALKEIYASGVHLGNVKNIAKEDIGDYDKNNYDLSINTHHAFPIGFGRTFKFRG